MENADLDRMFIGALRTNDGPIRISLDNGQILEWAIAKPDKRLGYELSLAFQSYYRRLRKGERMIKNNK